MNRRHENSRGTVMVELAIVLPLLVMLVFGITELGRAMYQLNTISKAAVTGARYLARVNGLVDRDDCTPDATTWGEVIPLATNLIIYGNAAGVGDPRLPGMEVSFDPPRLDDETASTACIISVGVTARFVSIFGSDALIPFTSIGEITLAQTVQERFIGE
jgi:hypothetical protein